MVTQIIKISRMVYTIIHLFIYLNAIVLFLTGARIAQYVQWLDYGLGDRGVKIWFPAGD
jgi:hypothetical protein